MVFTMLRCILCARKLRLYIPALFHGEFHVGSIVTDETMNIVLQLLVFQHGINFANEVVSHMGAFESFDVQDGILPSQVIKSSVTKWAVSDVSVCRCTVVLSTCLDMNINKQFIINF
jgi:hypothetical protein